MKIKYLILIAIENGEAEDFRVVQDWPSINSVSLLPRSTLYNGYALSLWLSVSLSGSASWESGLKMAIRLGFRVRISLFQARICFLSSSISSLTTLRSEFAVNLGAGFCEFIWGIGGIASVEVTVDLSSNFIEEVNLRWILVIRSCFFSLSEFRKDT